MPKGVIFSSYQPDLIDLHAYEHELMNAKRSGKILPMPMAIPALIEMPWTDAEMVAMRWNRREALELYESIKNEYT